jgi:hypothetical protein
MPKIIEMNMEIHVIHISSNENMNFKVIIPTTTEEESNRSDSYNSVIKEENLYQKACMSAITDYLEYDWYDWLGIKPFLVNSS